MSLNNKKIEDKLLIDLGFDPKLYAFKEGTLKAIKNNLVVFVTNRYQVEIYYDKRKKELVDKRIYLFVIKKLKNEYE
jgi:hypothetical protein